MKALVLCGEKLTKLYKKRIDKEKGNLLVIVTENNLFQQISETYKNVKVEFLYIYSDENFSDSRRLAFDISSKLEESITDVFLKGLPLVSVNGIYETYARVVVSVKNRMDELLEHYSVDEVCLLGGNKTVPFYPFNLAEGERPFRFLYKREFFLNPIIYCLIHKKVRVGWKQDFALSLCAVRWGRIQIINIGKIVKCVRKYSKTEARKAFKFSGDIVGIMIRTKPVINAMIPLYYAINEGGKYKAVFLIYENYSNSEVVNEIKTQGFAYVDLRQYTSIRKVLQTYRKVLKGTVKKSDKRERIYNIPLHVSSITRELKVQWWDSKLLSCVLSDFNREEGINLRGMINAETYNWVAATQGIWAKKNNKPIISIQFVTLDKRPKTVWVDRYYLMSEKEIERLGDVIPAGAGASAGPACYDYLYGKTEHRQGELRNITIFTQPDSLRKDGFRIIDDILDIRKELSENWSVKIKLHPRENAPQDFARKYLKYENVELIKNETDSTDLIKRADLAVGIVSTTLFQAVIIGTPAISVNYDNLNKGSMDIIEQEVVRKVTNKKELKEYLVNFAKYNILYVENRAGYLNSYMNGYDGKGSIEIAKYVNDTY